MTDEPNKDGERNLGGRPWKYDPAFIEILLELMAAGLSFTAVAGELGVSRSTLHNWRTQYPEFDEAAAIGQAKRTLKLERQLLATGITGPEVTARIFALKNACPEEWRDKIAIEGDVKHFLLEVPAEAANSEDWAAASQGRAA